MMAKVKINADDLHNTLELIEKLDKKDIESNNNLIDEISSPYTVGSSPKPKRWENKGIQHKIL